MTATLDEEIRSDTNGSAEMVCNYSIASEIVNNNIEKSTVMFDTYDSLFDEVFNELKTDFSSNFVSTLGKAEEEQLSERFRQVGGFAELVFIYRLVRLNLSFHKIDTLSKYHLRSFIFLYINSHFSVLRAFRLWRRINKTQVEFCRLSISEAEHYKC